MATDIKNKKLIICCDGTGNEIEENHSNVLKFYRLLKKNVKGQIAFYDTGIGTIGSASGWSAWKNQMKGVFGLITGYGLDENILEAYRFLIEHHEEGDEIYLFGYSRGAYTVRVLAGFINLVGILHKNQIHLAEYALTAYKQASRMDDFHIAWRIQRMLSTKRSTIRFMGCWDTVGSVIVPRPDRYYIPSFEVLPYTLKNPCVRTFRHAIAIDEKRRMYKVLPWKEGQGFKSNPFLPKEKEIPQDCKQMWFAGVHADIGGGYPEAESGAAKYPLGWMVEEARKNGLIFRETMVKRLVYGRTPKSLKSSKIKSYSLPDPEAELHNSMHLGWRFLEFFPKLKRYHDNPEFIRSGGIYFSHPTLRYIPEDAEIHFSVKERIIATNYAPDNLPGKYTEKEQKTS